MTKPDIKIGARGWRHTAWAGDFYPDDLPEDWRLTFYSNEFAAVLVPWDDLRAIQPQAVQTWVEDTRAGFEFFLELPVSAPEKRVDALLALLGPRLGGIVIKGMAGESAAPSILRWLEKARLHAPVAVDWRSLATDNPVLAMRQELGCHWRAEQPGEMECAGKLAIVETGGAIHLEPKLLKNVLQHCRSVRGPTTIGLFFGGAPPRIDEIRNAIMILQMLG